MFLPQDIAGRLDMLVRLEAARLPILIFERGREQGEVTQQSMFARRSLQPWQKRELASDHVVDPVAQKTRAPERVDEWSVELKAAED